MNSPSPINPYESPRVLEQLITQPPSADRTLALRRVRTALLILTIPTLWNFGCLNWPEFVGLQAPGGDTLGGRPRPTGAALGTIAASQLLFFGLMFVVLWFCTLKVFDWVALLIHRLFGGRTTTADWLNSMYHSLWTLVWASRLGALCYVGWIVLFFYAPGVDRLAVSVVLGTAGHLLGAGVYGTVFFNWYRLRHGLTEVEQQ